MLWLILFCLIAVLALVLVAGHSLLTWAERRGWVYYRSTDRPRPHSLGLFEEIYQPSVTHVIDQQVTEETEADQAESGEGANQDRPSHPSARRDSASPEDPSSSNPGRGH